MERELYAYKQYIRKYPTYSLLEYFSLEALDIYNNHEKGVKMEKIPYYDKKNLIKKGERNFLITQWELLEVCFNSIKYGNDYRNNKITRKDFYDLLNYTRNISVKLEKAESMTELEIHKHLVCITNMEFDLESPNIKGRFNRMYHIMFIINKNKKYNQTKEVSYIDLEKKFYDITNIEYIKFINCYMIICLLSIVRKNTNIMEIIKDIKFDITKLGFTLEDVKRIISLQCKEYDFYKDKNNWNILKYNPIVHSTKYTNKYIISNVSALMISFSEFSYWTIRNYYCDIKSQKFTNYFGHCFEFYLNDLFTTYDIKAKKLKEKINEKTPDWKLETNKFIFLIEQKSALFPIETRTITAGERFNKLDKYIKDNIVVAFEQLNNYEEISSKKVIRICLMYEKIYAIEDLQDIALSNVKLNSDWYLNWIMSIDEFEKLMFLLHKNEDTFNKLIIKKIKLEMENSSNGKSFDMILSDYKNDYIENKINYFQNIIRNDMELLKEQKILY